MTYEEDQAREELRRYGEIIDSNLQRKLGYKGIEDVTINYYEAIKKEEERRDLSYKLNKLEKEKNTYKLNNSTDIFSSGFEGNDEIGELKTTLNLFYDGKKTMF